MWSGTMVNMRSILLLTAWPPAIYVCQSCFQHYLEDAINLPFSITMAIGAHSYRIRSFPLGLFLSAGYAKIPPYSSVRYASATMLPMYRALYGLPPSLGRFKLSKYSLTGSSQYNELPSLTESMASFLGI